MIVPMKKVNLVLLARDQDAALKALRQVGVLHIVLSRFSETDSDSLSEKKTLSQRSLGLLDEAAAAKAKLKTPKSLASGAAQTAGQPNQASLAGDRLVEAVMELAEERQQLLEAINRDRSELTRLAAWGQVDPAALADLASRGLDFVLVEMTVKTRAALDDSLQFLELGRSAGQVRGLILRQADRDLALSEEIMVVRLPKKASRELREDIAQASARLKAIAESLADLAKQRSVIQATIRSLEAQIEFESVRQSLLTLTDPAEKDALIGLEGFVPEDELGLVIEAAKTNGWALLADEPGLDDAVPVKVKNSAIVRIIQPVFDFLGTVPNYREYDISAWFLLFFCCFFAMIFGDAGYGTILLITGAILALKSKANGQAMPDLLRLLLVLSGFTVLWGVLTLSWFGLQAEQLPSFLRAIAIDWLSSENPDSGDNIKVFCFVLGTLQLVVAHLKNIKRDIGSLKFLAEIGQLMMVLGMISLVLNLVISADRFPVSALALPLIMSGFVLNFLFGNYEGGQPFFTALRKSLIASLSDIVSVFLGIVNIFADIVSYIRLWAVGLAGVAISQTVNNMVGPLFGRAIFFLIGAAILFLGHGINILLCLLSVIVHGVRLNMLEFSGHLGMEWSGFSYDPFRERDDQTDSSSKELS